MSNLSDIINTLFIQVLNKKEKDSNKKTKVNFSKTGLISLGVIKYYMYDEDNEDFDDKDANEYYIPVPAIAFRLFNNYRNNLKVFLRFSEEFKYNFIEHEKIALSKSEFFNIESFNKNNIMKKTYQNPFSVLRTFSDYDNPFQSLNFVSNVNTNKNTSINSEILELKLINNKNDINKNSDLIVIPIINNDDSIRKIKDIYYRLFNSNIEEDIIYTQGLYSSYDLLDYLDEVNEIYELIKDYSKESEEQIISTEQNETLNYLFNIYDKKIKKRKVGDIIINKINKKMKNLLKKFDNNTWYFNIPIENLIIQAQVLNNIYEIKLYNQKPDDELNEKYDLIKKFSNDSRYYVLKFIPISTSYFKDILNNKNPYKQFLNAALKETIILYNRRIKSTIINFKKNIQPAYDIIYNIKKDLDKNNNKYEEDEFQFLEYYLRNNTSIQINYKSQNIDKLIDELKSDLFKITT